MSGAAPEIDANDASAVLAAYLGGYEARTTAPRVTATFLNNEDQDGSAFRPWSRSAP